MEQFNLNTIPGKVAPVCHASQYDVGRIIRVNLFEGDQVYTLDGTEVVSISVRKPDGHVVTEGITNTSAAYVEIITTEQMTACPGANLCELKIEKGADVLGTLNFILSVEEDPLAGGDQSESFIYNLAVQIAQGVAQEVANQYDSNNVIFDAAPVAGHGNGYAVTSEGVKTALDGKVNTTDFDATNLPITSGSATNTKDYIDNRTINDLSNVVITSPAANDLLARNSGNTAWVNIPQFGLIKTKIVEDTTSASGAIAHGIDLSKNIILYGTSTNNSSVELNRFAFLRSASDSYMTVFQSSAGSNPPFYPLVNTAVKITIFYI